MNHLEKCYLCERNKLDTFEETALFFERQNGQ